MDYKGYLDEYGMVTVNEVPGYPAGHSENGLLFTAVAMQSCELNNELDPFEFEKLFEPCFINGILYRSPEPYPKPESHDNYTGIVLGSLLENKTSAPRKLLWSMIKHFGYINTEFVGRFPQLWILLFASSFPLLRYLSLPLLYVLYLLQTPKEDAMNDTSGVQLQFTIVSAIDKLFPCFKFLDKWFAKLKKYTTMYAVMSAYYSPNHPTALVWKDSKVC